MIFQIEGDADDVESSHRFEFIFRNNIFFYVFFVHYLFVLNHFGVYLYTFLSVFFLEYDNQTHSTVSPLFITADPMNIWLMKPSNKI